MDLKRKRLKAEQVQLRQKGKDKIKEMKKNQKLEASVSRTHLVELNASIRVSKADNAKAVAEAAAAHKVTMAELKRTQKEELDRNAAELAEAVAAHKLMTATLKVTHSEALKAAMVAYNLERQPKEEKREKLAKRKRDFEQQTKEEASARNAEIAKFQKTSCEQVEALLDECQRDYNEALAQQHSAEKAHTETPAMKSYLEYQHMHDMAESVRVDLENTMQTQEDAERLQLTTDRDEFVKESARHREQELAEEDASHISDAQRVGR